MNLILLCGGRGADGLRCGREIEPPAHICSPAHLPERCWFPGCKERPAPAVPLRGFCVVHWQNGFNVCAVDGCAEAPVQGDALCQPHLEQEEELRHQWTEEHFTHHMTPELRKDFDRFWFENGSRYYRDVPDRKEAKRRFHQWVMDGAGYPKIGMNYTYIVEPPPMLPRKPRDEEPFAVEEFREGLTFESQIARASSTTIALGRLDRARKQEAGR